MTIRRAGGVRTALSAPSVEWQRLLEHNKTGANYASLPADLGEPATVDTDDPDTTGNWRLIDTGDWPLLRLAFFGTDADGETGSCKIVAFGELYDQASPPATTSLYLPDLVLEMDFTLGPAATAVSASTRLADLISNVDGVSGYDGNLDFDDGTHQAWILLDVGNYRQVGVFLKCGTAASVNAMWALVG